MKNILKLLLNFAVKVFGISLQMLFRSFVIEQTKVLFIKFVIIMKKLTCIYAVALFFFSCTQDDDLVKGSNFQPTEIETKNGVSLTEED
jgi:hypothetical protein